MIPEEEGDGGVEYSEDEFEEEDIVERNDDSYDQEGDDGDEDWEDVDSQGGDDKMQDETIRQNKPAAGTKKKEVWDESKEPLKEGEELVYDSSAYQMLHRAKVEWPCLSIDILLRDRINSTNNQWFPNYVHSMDPSQ